MVTFVTSKILTTISLELDEINLIIAALKHASESAGIEGCRNVKVTDLLDDFETVKQRAIE